MQDTDRALQKLYRQKIMERSGIERLRMGDGMFASARAIVLAGLSDVSEEEKPFNLFLRFYGNDFSAEQKKQIKKFFQPGPNDVVEHIYPLDCF